MFSTRLFYCFLTTLILIGLSVETWASIPDAFEFNFIQPKSTKVYSRLGMVVSTQREASKIGINILRQGGNAVDAAVAIGYALAVTDPCCGNLGGGGFMLIQPREGKAVFLDFRERAPLKADANMYLNGSSQTSRSGYLSVAIPGTVMGLEAALTQYGTMNRSQIIKPAIELAEKGFVLTQGDVANFQKGLLKIQKTDLAKIFLKPDGNLYREGDRLIQPQLASTLRQISQGGANTFYRGKIATDIVNSSNKGGGILTQEDFTQYRIKQSKPLYCNYRGYQIITTPPPGGGIVLCELLNILEGYPLQKTGLKTPLSLHWFLDAMFYAFQDRNMYLGDPDFVKIPIERLSSKKYAAKLRELIPVYYAASNPQKNTKLPIDGQTTHYSVVDRYGNAVSVTYTLNSYFGAGVMAQNTGFILNNEMDDFTTELGKVNQFGLKQGSNNLIQPGKQPLSSMTPTIVKKNNHLFLVTGSPGGSTIITTVLQIITNIIDYQFPLDKAVNQPRIHYQGIPNYVMLEKNGLPQSTISALETRGYIFNKTMSNWGAAETILRDSNGLLEGVNDYRKPAGAALAE